MDAPNDKKNGSTGRGRGHSMLSPLTAMNQEQDAGNHPGISFQRLRPQEIGNVGASGAGVRPSIFNATGRMVSDSQVSTLTMALQAAGVGETARSDPITIKTSESIPDDATSPGSYTGDDSESDEEGDPMPDHPFPGQPDLRNWCTGLPPKKSYLSSKDELPARRRKSRRSTLADLPELDHLLAGTKINYKGQSYLPLTATTIHRLDPFFKGAKPLADMTLFESMIINQEINGVHSDDAVAALESIGEHCKLLLVMAPIQTSELGNVFVREVNNISTRNDWDIIIECFPNVTYIAFVPGVGEPVGFSGSTFQALSAAVARRQSSQEALGRYSFKGPIALLK